MIDPMALPFADYEPHPQGGYMFQPHGGGAPQRFDGPEAKRIAGLIDQTKAVDNRLASNDDRSAIESAMAAGPSPMPQKADWNPAGKFAIQTSSKAPESNPLAKYASEDPRIQIAAAKSGPLLDQSALSPSLAASVTPSVPALPESAPGKKPVAAGPKDPRVFSPDAPPIDQLQPSYSPGQGAPAAGGVEFEKLPTPHAGKAQFRPVSRTVEEEGGVQDPEAKALLTKAYGDDLRATNTQEKDMTQFLGTQLSDNELRSKQAQLEAQRAEDQIAKAQAVKAAAKQEYDQHMSYAQEDLEKESKREVDQYRLFKGRPGAEFLANLGVAFGAIGAGILGGPNNALQSLNRQIDNDIQAQRDEILRGTNTKQNDLQRIREKYGVDTDEAANILNVALTQKAQAVAQAQAAQAGTTDAQKQMIALQTWGADRNAAIADKMTSQIYGKHKESSQERYGSTGGYDPLTAAKRQDEYETLQGRAKLRREHPEWTEAQIKNGLKQGGAGGGQGAAAAATIASIDANASVLGLSPDAANPSKVVVADEDKTPTGKLGRASQWMGEAFGTDEAQKKQQAMRDIARAGATAGKGGTVNHEIYEENMKLLHSANSPEMLSRIVTDIKRKAVVMHGEQSKGGATGGSANYSEGEYDPSEAEPPGDAAEEATE